MTINPGKSKKHEKKKSRLADVGQSVAHALQQITATRQMVAEVVEDNMALLEAVKRNAENQEGMRATIVREIDHLREQVYAELQFQILKNACKEMVPVLHAIRRMASDGDFSDTEVTRQHVESLASTLDSALRRLGIARLEVCEGVDVFNENLHECIKVCDGRDSPLPDAPHRAIVCVEESGYAINGRLAMPARVWVQRKEDETSCQGKGLIL